MAIANQNPQNIQAKYSISFTTTNLDNGETFSEPHTASIEAGTYNIPLNAISIGNGKMVIPLTTNTTQGSHFLKLHLPQPGSSIMYVTFAQKNNAMADGYYDYITGIPSAYRSSLRTWIKDQRITNVSTPTVLDKGLKFKVYGLDTNLLQSAIEFEIKFSATFGVASPPRSAAPSTFNQAPSL